MKDYKILREELLSDSEVLKEYQAHRPEYEVAKALIKARIASNMTQVDVARRMQTSQAQIARLESGEHLPSIHSIYKYAQAVNRKISLSIAP
ncbi:MAG: helix-turn-helix domain-containing protein [Candidatus Paracaedibacter sp.]